MLQHIPLAFGWVPIIRRQPVHISVPLHDGTTFGLAKPRSRCGQRIEHCLEIEGGSADDLEYVGGGCLLLQRFTQFIKETGILDGDDGLGGEVLNQLYLLIGEWLPLLTVNDNRADQLVVLQHRRGSKSPRATQFGEVPERPIFNPILYFRDVGDVCDLPRSLDAVHGASGGGNEKWLPCALLGERAGDIMRGDRTEAVALG